MFYGHAHCRLGHARGFAPFFAAGALNRISLSHFVEPGGGRAGALPLRSLTTPTYQGKEQPPSECSAFKQLLDSIIQPE
jgi:hypothetical protein